MAYRTKQKWRRALRGVEVLEPRLLLAAQPIVTEFMASNNSSLNDGFGHDSDWIELYNAGDAAVNLQGYHLTDSLNNLSKWTFPASTVLNPTQYLIVFASDLNTIDPLGYYHTNFKLAAEGEDIALVAPDLTILSQFGPSGVDYPPQFTDISYGISGSVLINGDSPASYLIPTNGNLGLTWTATDFNAAANGFATGKSAIGYDTTPTPYNFANYFRTAVPAGTTSVYLRSEFNLASVTEVSNLTLNMKYDDAVVVYLNGHKVLTTPYAPASPVYNSLASNGRDDVTVIAGDSFSLSPYLQFLQSGKNVLAIHLLNQGSSSSDLLVAPVLTAQLGSGSIGYLTPTPGAGNSVLREIGPIIDPVNFSPNNPADNETITVTAHVAPYAAPVNTSAVELIYRVMFGAEVAVAMVDDGTGGDSVAGDGTFTARIPESAYTAGQMVRWYVVAADTMGMASRAPRFADPVDSPQYFGAVIANPSITTKLPVIHWFVQDPNAAATESGTRASLYMNGEFYDNIEVDLHGQSTAQPQFTKKSFNFDANSGLKFQVDPAFGRVSDFNLLTNLTDKTYLRNTLAYELFTEAGGAGLYAFSAVVYRNGSYYAMYDVVEDGDEEFLDRVGLDSNGALYKMTNALVSSTNLVEKKTRNYEGNSDLQQVVNTASLNALQGEIWVYDNLDLAEWANYFAVQSLIGNRDFGDKNYYMYRDTEGTGLWSIIPWDVDLSYGHQWNPSENYFDDDLIYNDGFWVNQGNNHLMNRLKTLSKFNEMYHRRLRTLLDEFYGPPGGSIDDSYIGDRFDELINEIGVDALYDRNIWGTTPGMAYETPTQAIARVKQNFLTARKQFLQTLSGLPSSQVATPSLSIGTIDYDPTSGNQAQEYFTIVNGGSAAVDISGWTIAGGISHTFEGGTVIPGNSTLYVVADVAQFKLRTIGPTGGQRLLTQGNYDGQLNNSYGQLLLKNTSNVTIASASFGTPPLAGDYDASGSVDILDYDVWMSTFGQTENIDADGNGNSVVDAADYIIWRSQLGATNGSGSGSVVRAAAEPADVVSAVTSTTDELVGQIDDVAFAAWGRFDNLAVPSRSRVLANGDFRAWSGGHETSLLLALAERRTDSAQRSPSLSTITGQGEAAIDTALAEDPNAGFSEMFRLSPAKSKSGRVAGLGDML